MRSLSSRQLLFVTTFGAIFGSFLWACSDSGTGSSSGSSQQDSSTGTGDGATGSDSGNVGKCAAPKTTCGTDCVDTATSDDHCGACGKKCGQGEMCAQGKCVVDCPSGSTKCSAGGKDTCVNAATDNANCGACGKKCDSGYVCSAGKCELTCTAGYTACTGTKAPSDAGADAASFDAGAVAPYCANLQQEFLNCGTCGNRCTLGQSCSGGLCCNGSQIACGGKCTDVAEDPDNCASCGKKCPSNTPYCSAGVCVDRYVFSGVKTNLDVTAATKGWTECFKEGYDHDTSTATLKAACNKGKIMMACRPTGAASFTVAAQAPRADVFFDTGTGSNSVHDANGVAWYYNDNWSFGFAPQGVTVSRNSCDTEDLNNGDPNFATRMCVHTGGNSTNWGWRCGGNFGIDTGWERILYHAD